MEKVDLSGNCVLQGASGLAQNMLKPNELEGHIGQTLLL
jgi:hypothetical protein